MSAVIATPELIEAAATDLAGIGSTVNAAHMTAGPSTLFVRPAAADEVSAGIAHLFSGYAQDYHALAGKAAAFQEQFVQHLTTSAGAYAGAEAANMASLIKPLTAIGAPIAAAATTAQSTMSDLIANVITNIQAGIETLITMITSLLMLLAIVPFLLLFLLSVALYGPWWLVLLNAGRGY
ncbi:PE family protein [Mycobacterium sp. E796]|uniref:PE family protein n=1 Tax=Mycobacterium sp. E796 TaxID=1834151 RepID=UPI0007FBAC48|nr:PE family protein [Mycobacterium sp. E796]OBI54011.1 hypothetical protein A5706_21730 [Mycobacterium sp. E796]